MALEGRTYKLALRKTARGPVIQFRSATPETREATLIRMGGKKAEEVFAKMVEVLKNHDLVESESKSENYTYYKLKPEAGPVVGGYLILIRRSRDPTAWLPLFEDFVVDKFKGSHKLLEHMLALGIELSQIHPPPERVRMQLNPKILDSLSAGMKVTVKKLWGIKK
ncbi:hypothetical protein [Stetteria hydrogenophila]